MKLFRKEKLYIRTTQDTEEQHQKRNWIPYIGAGIFILLVVVSIFFVDGTLLPSKNDKEYKTSQTVILPMVSISSLNPLNSKDEDTYYISKLIYDSLFTMDESMTPTSQLVEKYTINQKTRSIDLTLRQNVVWHDGNGFTSADVKYTIDALKASGDRNLYQSEISNISKVKVNDNYQVSIYFNSPAEMSLDLLTFPILPKHQFNKIGDAVDKVSGFQPVGTGAYKYQSFDPTSQLTLVANSEYFGDIPRNKLVFQMLPNKVNFFNLLKASNLSLIISKVATRESEISGEDVKVVDFPSNEVEYLGYNFLQPDLAKRNVRIAIASALNPQAMIDENYYGSGITNDDLYFPGYLGVEQLKEPYVFDGDVSEESLKKSGYEDINGDGYVEDGAGNPFILRILVNSDNGSRVLSANQIVASLKDVGVSATVDAVDWETYLAQLQSGDFDLYLGGMKISKNMDLRSLLATGGANNYLHYSNGKLDDLLAQMRSGLTPDQMKTTYVKIREIIHDDLPYFCLLYKTFGAIQSPALVGDVTPTFENYYKDCQTWYCRYEVTTPATEE
jgi:peptide/nickel transport system substrate-binding protein